MTFGWVALALIYLLGLFWIANWGDKNTPLARKLTSHPLTYSLALAIYCTAWTFFGSVGEASKNNWQYLPILLGPILVYLFAYRFILKLTQVSKKQHITTIADFISSRYGKRQGVALVVTIIALMATIPYVALQLKAIGSAFQQISNQQNSQLIIILATFFIAIFSIYFGTKRTDVTEYRRGLILAIAFESTVKLIALVAVAFIGYFWAMDKDAGQFILAIDKFNQLETFKGWSFIAQTIMAAAAIICLPRQFHVAVIDNLNLNHLKTARWLFPLYLAATAAVIPAITAAGQTLLGPQNPDTYVLGLAILFDSSIIKVLVFLGGLSAAMAMIVIATLTLSTMVTNDVILPKILTRAGQNQPQLREDKQPTNYAKIILLIRRAVIAGLLVLAYIYHQQMADSHSLSFMGLIAFSLVIQLLPAIIGGLYWKKGHAHGVYAGLVVGIMTWVLWLILPLINYETSQQIQSETISMGAMISLAANTFAFILVSTFTQDRLIDRLQAQAFVTPRERQIDDSKKQRTLATIGDMATLMTRFLGPSRSESLLNDFERRRGSVFSRHATPEPDFLMFCEKALAGVLGSSSAKALIDSALSGKKLNFEEVVTFFDDTTQAIQFNTTALFTSIESLEQGISVIDKDLNLVAWNKRYLQLFDYPEEFISVGTPIEKLIRFNAIRGECGVGEIDTLVNKRLDHMKSGHPHRFVRQRSDGKMIEMVGNPLPGGGFVTSFNDITSHIEIQKALKEANIDLEKGIEKRGEEVKAINAELRTEIVRRSRLEAELVSARKVAEEANASKTQFLALASHDILQPLNAAKLYLSALDEYSVNNEVRTILDKLNDSVGSSETLIATLLDIAKLDQGEMKTVINSVLLSELLKPLIAEFSMKAKHKRLNFRYKIADVWVETDRTCLYRIIQNLVSNAIKYTATGSVMLTARKRNEHILIQIWDTGLGISEIEQQKVFGDFYRVEGSKEHGVGLGLGVVSRLSEKLSMPISVSSTLNKGSCFGLLVPEGQPIAKTINQTTNNKSQLSKLKVLCVDDIEQNLDAMQTLLGKWQIESLVCKNIADSLTLAKELRPNVLLVDYNLGKNSNGLEAIAQLRDLLGEKTPAAMVTANQDETLIEACQSENIGYLSKPIKPAKLRALLNSFVTQL